MSSAAGLPTTGPAAVMHTAFHRPRTLQRVRETWAVAAMEAEVK
jgi:hypothetical protein